MVTALQLELGRVYLNNEPGVVKREDIFARSRELDNGAPSLEEEPIEDTQTVADAMVTQQLARQRFLGATRTLSPE